MAVALPNWIISLGFLSEIHKVLELNFHFITMMSLSISSLAVLAVENV